VNLFCLYRDVLGAEQNAAIYRHAVAQQDAFERSRVAHRGVDLDTRASRVVYGDRLGEVATVLEAAVRARVAEALDRLGLPTFDIGAFEIQMTSHNDGDFFTRHTDNASRETASRTLTFVYYFHAEPARFTGGDLVFVDRAGRESVVTPGNDNLILFDPHTAHEVRRISCPSGRFEDGRFTLNGWLHRQAAAPRPGSFFDRRIFTPVGRWTAPPPLRPFHVSPSAPTRATPSRHRVRETTATAGSPSGHAAALLRLYGDLHRTAPHPDAIDVRTALPGARFLEEYYARNRPVVLPGFLGNSDALSTWSPEYFATHYGHVQVQITAGRERSADYERRFRETLHVVTLRELTERLTSSSDSNDFYLVARNNFFENPQLRELRDALHPPDDIIDDADRRPGSAKLWVGPRGTVTPLHYDEHSILFTQVHGTKQVKLIPSFDHGYMYARDTYYSEVDPDDVDQARHPLFAKASVMDVVVEPGDGLFIPAGWWHWARSLSVSISATFSSFAWPWVNTRLADASVSDSTR
jgi:predicted 2-oxoglutarate/Fe(II)-dependent dioxygenase YbiX